MVIVRTLRTLLSLLWLAFAATPALAQDSTIDIDAFYQQLEPYGRWFEHPRWGTVWRPNVDADWRPYSRGSWVYTDDYGWYWEAEEPWGWAPFHYGRWLFDEDGFWIWIPDVEWGPAWVAWRADGDYVGWAPLPPDAEWGPDGDLLFDSDFYSEVRLVSVWCFVPSYRLILPRIHRFILPRRQNPSIFRHTHFLHGYRRSGGRIVNAGFDVRRLERMTGRPVVRTRVRAVDSPSDPSLGGGRNHGAEVPVYKPHVSEQPGVGRIHRPLATDRNRPRVAPPLSARPSPTAPDGDEKGRSRTLQGSPPGFAGPGTPRALPAEPGRLQQGERPGFRRGEGTRFDRHPPSFGAMPPERGRGPPPGLPNIHTRHPPPSPQVRTAPPAATRAPAPGVAHPSVRMPAPDRQRTAPGRDDKVPR